MGQRNFNDESQLIPKKIWEFPYDVAISIGRSPHLTEVFMHFSSSSLTVYKMYKICLNIEREANSKIIVFDR